MKGINPDAIPDLVALAEMIVEPAAGDPNDPFTFDGPTLGDIIEAAQKALKKARRK